MERNKLLPHSMGALRLCDPSAFSVDSAYNLAETSNDNSILRKLLKIFPKSLMKKIPYNYKYQYLKNSESHSMKILTDDVELDTINPDKEFNFNDYSKAILSIVNGSYQKFAIGNYGEWGTIIFTLTV